MAVLTTTSQKRTAWRPWLDHCGRGGDYVNQMFFGKTIGGVPNVWADAVKALEAALRAGGYVPKGAWSYNFRGISGAACTCSSDGHCSLHAYGLAIDIDPGLNRQYFGSTFTWSRTAFTPQQIALVEGIKNTNGERVWQWGGRWSSMQDYMHFETNVDPRSTEIDQSTVPGTTGDEDMPFLPLNYGEGLKDDEIAKLQTPGDAPSPSRYGKRSDVAVIQGLLKRAYGADLEEDGRYDDKMAAEILRLGINADSKGHVITGSMYNKMMDKVYGGASGPQPDLSKYATTQELNALGDTFVGHTHKTGKPS